MRAARDGHGAPAQGSRTWHSSELALRVFACARGRTRSFHAVCVEKGMRGAGRACIGVWEFGVCPEGGVVWATRLRTGAGGPRYEEKLPT